MLNKVIVSVFAGAMFFMALSAQSEEIVNKDVAAQNDLNLDEGASSDFYAYDYCLYYPYAAECLGGTWGGYYGGSWGGGRSWGHHGHRGHHGHHGGGHRGGGRR